MRRGLIISALAAVSLATAACGGGAANALQSVASAASKTAGVETVQFLTVVRTAAGCANLVARALDERELPGVVGTLAGDDTIIVVHPDPKSAVAFHHFLNG